MKKLRFLLFGFAAITFHQAIAQDTTRQSVLSPLLVNYFHMKDALVQSNGTRAAAAAINLIKVLNSIDYKIISEGNINALLKDATRISETSNLEKQRSYFAGLSDNMIILAKAYDLSPEPVYQAYCPMKKASWLSNEKVIKNPYFGSAMLSCGEVVDTIAH